MTVVLLVLRQDSFGALHSGEPDSRVPPGHLYCASCYCAWDVKTFGTECPYDVLGRVRWQP